METCEHCHDTGVVTLPLAYEDEDGSVGEGVNTIACPYCDLGKFGKNAVAVWRRQRQGKTD